MATLLMYVGQVCFIVGKEKKKTTGVGIIVSKYIEKGNLKYEILGMDGNFYKEIDSDRVRNIVEIKSDKVRRIIYGPAWTKILGTKSLKAKIVTTNRDRWLEWLGAVWNDLKSSKLFAEDFNMESQKDCIDEESDEEVDCSKLEHVSASSRNYNNCGYGGCD